MLRFQDFLREFKFADLSPKTGEWKQIPVTGLQAAQHEPPTNIDTELFDLINTSYGSIGGHIDFRRPSDLPGNHTIWYAVDTDGDKEPNAVTFGKKVAGGMKWTGLASDGTSEGKYKALEAIAKQLKSRGNYCEASDALMHILITRYQVPYVETQKKVEQVIGKSVNWIGAHPQGKYAGYTGFYERELGGHRHLKILLGLFA